MASKFFHDTFKAAAESVMPVLSTSQFKDKGVLTPDEFVEAGDLLVFKCPTWSWCADTHRPAHSQDP
jgi:ubiquitin-like-conjugating enzyme ATG3